MLARNHCLVCPDRPGARTGRCTLCAHLVVGVKVDRRRRQSRRAALLGEHLWCHLRDGVVLCGIHFNFLFAHNRRGTCGSGAGHYTRLAAIER